MVLTAEQKRARNAGYQRVWRERREALMRSNPDAIEAALLQRAERSSQLSTEERTALADKLADAAMMHLRHSQELARVATKVRAGEV
jgi:hypothetical protein